MHLTPVWYLFEDERLFVETAATDRKVRNILARPAASLLVDSRKQGAERDIPHTFRNIRPATGKLLLTIILGHFADYFLEVGGVPGHDHGAIEALSAKYGVAILE